MALLIGYSSKGVEQMKFLPFQGRSNACLLAASLALISLLVVVSIETSHASSQLSVLSANGKLAFKSGSGIYTLNPDGSAQIGRASCRERVYSSV